MPVRFDDILTAFEFVDSDGSHDAFVCRRTGKVYWHFDLAELDEIEDELPEGAEDDPNYVAIPRKQELGLGKALALGFADEFLPKDFDEVRNMFGRGGAYQKFKALLRKRNALERWYDFESEATGRALREWCKLNEIELTD
jgi:hypothetical protein